MMRRKSVLVGLALVLGLTGSIGGLLLLFLHEPELYRKAAVPAGPERKKRSREFYNRSSKVSGYIYNGEEREWCEEFTQDQINSYFEEDFVRSGVAERMLPEGIRAPRIAIQPDNIRLAFRYDPWRTVISIDMRMWLAPQQPNVVALEIKGLYTGALPIAAQSLLERISDTGRGHDLEVTWYRLDNGNPVALLRLQADQKRATVQLRRLEVHDGRIVIGGSSASFRAMLESLGIFPPTASY
jgi:hypothetical protein